jgi:hypothetical protein
MYFWRIVRRILYFLLTFSGFTAMAQDTLLLISGRKMVVRSVALNEDNIEYKKLKKDRVRHIDPMRVFSIIYSDGREKVIYQPDSLDPIDFRVEEMRTFITGTLDARAVYENRLLQGMGLGVGASAAPLAFYGLVGPPLYATFVGSFSPNVERVLTIRVGGSAAEDLGLKPGKYVNEVTGSVSGATVRKDKVLKLSCTKIRFDADASLEEVVQKINAKVKRSKVHALAEQGVLKLYKTKNTSLIADPNYREGFEKRVRDYKIRNGMLSALAGFIGGIIAFSVLAD